MSACAQFIQNNDQLKYVGTIRPGSNGIAAPAFIWFFMNGKVEGDRKARRFEKVNANETVSGSVNQLGRQ